MLQIKDGLVENSIFPMKNIYSTFTLVLKCEEEQKITTETPYALADTRTLDKHAFTQIHYNF